MQKEITPKRVPKSRLERAVGFGELALRVGANVAKSTLSELAQGRRPDRRTLLLNSENLETMTDTLARMRGAAMKLGQLLSMDDQTFFLPKFLRSYRACVRKATRCLQSSYEMFWMKTGGQDGLKDLATLRFAPLLPPQLGKCTKLSRKMVRIWPLRCNFKYKRHHRKRRQKPAFLH